MKKIILFGLIAVLETLTPITSSFSALSGYCEGGISDGLACQNHEDCPGGRCAFEVSRLCDSFNCRSSSWTAYSTGYETRTYRHCSSSTTCSSLTQYRCAAGFYGATIRDPIGCSRCPSIDGIISTSVPSNEVLPVNSITDCYLESGATGIDATGTYTYTEDCYYTE